MCSTITERSVIDINPLLLKILLVDKTTGKYIRWATDNYLNHGDAYAFDEEILPELVSGESLLIVQPRMLKSHSEQTKRTRDKAEVFTPSWICNRQNNLIDHAWFGRDGVFNIECDDSWIVTTEPVEFPTNKGWKKYVDAQRLEVSCGEAPYLVSRYDSVSGQNIPIHSRIGLLDRKMRIVNENAASDDKWIKWMLRAFQSIYGYDYQGDNVLLARKNLFFSFVDYYTDHFNSPPPLALSKKVANIIAWNIWQMDAFTFCPPSSLKTDSLPFSPYEQISFDFYGENNSAPPSPFLPTCRIFDWRSKCSIEFQSLMKGEPHHG